MILRQRELEQNVQLRELPLPPVQVNETPQPFGAADVLAAAGTRVRVVSMPCCTVFDAQDADYREAVLPSAVRTRLAVEASWPDYWRRYVGLDGDVLGIDHFGASAPGSVLAGEFGFTVDAVVARARALLA